MDPTNLQLKEKNTRQRNVGLSAHVQISIMAQLIKMSLNLDSSQYLQQKLCYIKLQMTPTILIYSKFVTFCLHVKKDIQRILTKSCLQEIKRIAFQLIPQRISCID